MRLKLYKQWLRTYQVLQKVCTRCRPLLEQSRKIVELSKKAQTIINVVECQTKFKQKEDKEELTVSDIMAGLMMVFF